MSAVQLDAAEAGQGAGSTDAPVRAPHGSGFPGALVWRPRHAVALVLAVAVITLIASRVLRAMPTAGLSATQSSLAILTTFAAAYAVELGIVWLVARRAGFGLAESVGMRLEPGMGRAFATSLAAGFALRMAAAAYALAMLAMRLQLPGWDSNPVKYFPRDTLGSAVLVMVVVVAAPIVEEVVFRGVLLPSLAARLGEGWGVAIATVVFAGMHLNLFAFAPILLVGWTLAALFLRSRSLWVSIACHSFFNGIGVLAVIVLRGNGVV